MGGDFGRRSASALRLPDGMRWALAAEVKVHFQEFQQPIHELIHLFLLAPQK
jgi:hypothetical protein